MLVIDNIKMKNQLEQRENQINELRLQNGKYKEQSFKVLTMDAKI